jgi:hypothetical protein
MIQAPRMTRELKPLLTSPCTRWLERCHHASKASLVYCGTSYWSPTSLNSPPPHQTCFVKTQDTSKWLIISSCWTHRGSAPNGSCHVWLACLRSNICCVPLAMRKICIYQEPKTSTPFQLAQSQWCPERGLCKLIWRNMPENESLQI